MRRGRGSFRQALVKWFSEANPTWEPIESIIDTEALDNFESVYGPITKNDGPPNTTAETFLGPAEPETVRRRRERKYRK